MRKLRTRAALLAVLATSATGLIGTASASAEPQQGQTEITTCTKKKIPWVENGVTYYYWVKICTVRTVPAAA